MSPKPRDYRFDVTVDTVGSFTFQPLTVGQQIGLRTAAQAIYGGPLPTVDDDDGRSMEESVAWMLAEMRAACLEAPADWSWLDGYTLDPILKTWKEYSAKRDEFRKTLGR